MNLSYQDLLEKDYQWKYNKCTEEDKSKHICSSHWKPARFHRLPITRSRMLKLGPLFQEYLAPFTENW